MPAACSVKSCCTVLDAKNPVRSCESDGVFYLWRAHAIAEAQKEAFAEAMDTQLATKSDLMEMENRLIKRSIGLVLGQVAIIAAWAILL